MGDARSREQGRAAFVAEDLDALFGFVVGVPAHVDVKHLAVRESDGRGGHFVDVAGEPFLFQQRCGDLVPHHTRDGHGLGVAHEVPGEVDEVEVNPEDAGV